MKFSTENVTKCAARLGTLSEFIKFPDIIFETPLPLLYTKKGSVPHLTKDVLKMLTTEHHLLSVSLASTITMSEAIQLSNLSFTEFVSMKEYPIFFMLQDPAELNNPVIRKKESIAVWTKQGYHYLDSKKYMDIVENFKPDIYVALCDGETDENSSKKRISKSLENSKRLFEQCFKRHQASEILKNSCLLGAIEGGFDLSAREESIKYLREKNLEGYVIDGLHKNGPSIQDIPIGNIKEVVQHTINLLPTEKLKVSIGSWNPLAVLELIELGVDIFDSSYPYVLTEASKALTLINPSKEGNQLTISIADKSLANDFRPICELCECLTCKNHTRAYLNHLCQTRELLMSVLLMIHNTHQYLEFFKLIRKHLKSGTFAEFKNQIAKFFPDVS